MNKFFGFCLVLFFSFGRSQNRQDYHCDNNGGITLNNRPRFNVEFECCKNSEGKFELYSSSRNESCCLGSEYPVYNKRTKFCNGSRVIEYNSDFYQCRPDRVCVRGAPSVNTILDPSNHESSKDQLACIHSDKDCCGGQKITKEYICYENRKFLKEHPSHNDVCGRKTFNNKKKICTNGKTKNLRCSKSKDSFSTKGIICCGGRSEKVKDDFLCCQGEYVNIFQCKDRSNVQTSFFKVEKFNKTVDNCKVMGNLLRNKMNATPGFTFYLKPSMCSKKKFRKNKWYIVLNKESILPNNRRLHVNNKQSIEVLRLSKHTSSRLDSLWQMADIFPATDV